MVITPSLLGLVVSGILTLVAVVYLLMNYSVLKTGEMIMVLFLLAIAIGMHSTVHYLQEKRGFNPLGFVSGAGGCPCGPVCSCAVKRTGGCPCGMKCLCATHRPVL